MLTADFEGHIYSLAVAEAAAKTVVEAAVAESEYVLLGLLFASVHEIPSVFEVCEMEYRMVALKVDCVDFTILESCYAVRAWLTLHWTQCKLC